MKKTMVMITLASMIGLAIAGAIYSSTGSPVFFSAAITFGTTFYHLAMRLTVGSLIGAKYHNRMDYTKKWFAEKPFEPKLYKLLRVKKWKKRFPTLNPQDFDIKAHSAEEIAQATCQAEVVHEVCMILGLLPILSSVWFGSLGVFVLTSCAASVFDGIFVIMQRYNRPRLIRLMKKANRSATASTGS